MSHQFIDTQLLNPPTASNLSNLGPGCFVKVREQDRSFWAEIIKIENSLITARLHAELAKRNIAPSSKKIVTFERTQIIDLGCDNYCWC